jgi:hypothetical protein
MKPRRTRKHERHEEDISAFCEEHEEDFSLLVLSLNLFLDRRFLRGLRGVWLSLQVDGCPRELMRRTPSS